MNSSYAEAIYVGLLVSMSSTAICLKDLTQRGTVNTLSGQITMGVLVMQDMVLGVVLAFLPAFQAPVSSYLSMIIILAKPAVFLIIFALGMLIMADVITPVLLIFLSRFQSKELYTVGCVAYVMFVSAVAEHVGLSFEMGSFVAGMSLSRVPSTLRHDANELTEALNHFFAALFFAAIGFVIDPLFLWDNIATILGICLSIGIFKMLVYFFVLLLTRAETHVCTKVSMSLGHIGEFALVLAAKGNQIDILSRKVYLLLLGTTTLSLFVTPLILKLASYIPQREILDDQDTAAVQTRVNQRKVQGLTHVVMHNSPTS